MHLLAVLMAKLFVGPYGFLLDLANKHKGFRRGLVVWAAMQCGWVIHQVFGHMEQISASVVSALTVTVAPLVALIVYYVKLRNDNDDGDDDAGPPKA